jgi:DNA transposition AAA+ family ATPase
MTKQQKFWITQEHKRFDEFCDACRQDRSIGLCYGIPGVGKTVSARRYAHWEQIAPCLAPFPDDGKVTIPHLAPRHLLTLLYTPNVVHTPQRLRNQIRELRATLMSYRFHHLERLYPAETFEQRNQHLRQGELLIIDEADRLTTYGFEEVRDVYDRFDLAVVFIGMPGIEKRLARYPQLYSRIGFVHPFRHLSEAQMQPILDYQWHKACRQPFDPQQRSQLDARAAILTMTRGNFRLMDRLFAQIERVLKINRLQMITPEVVEVARQGLVVGTV